MSAVANPWEKHDSIPFQYYWYAIIFLVFDVAFMFLVLGGMVTADATSVDGRPRSNSGIRSVDARYFLCHHVPGVWYVFRKRGRIYIWVIQMAGQDENYAAFNSRALVEMVGDVSTRHSKPRKVSTLRLAGRYFPGRPKIPVHAPLGHQVLRHRDGGCCNASL